MQIQPDGDLKWILVYQDHLTKFVHVRPVKSKRVPEIAYQLLGIFSILGAPRILQSDNGREFVNSIINKLNETWVGLKLVHGKPRQNQSQRSVEQINRDREDVLTVWLRSIFTTQGDGLGFFQVIRNRAYHKCIKCLLYEAMFGHQ